MVINKLLFICNFTVINLICQEENSCLMKKTDLSDLGIVKELIIKRLNNELQKYSKKEQILLKKNTGLSPSQISDLLSGRTDPVLELVIRFANALNISMDYILYGKEKESDFNCIEIPCIDYILSKDQKIKIKEDNCFFMQNDLIKSKKLYCLSIEGDIMCPTLKEGDKIIIDFSRKMINEGRIHVFFHKDILFIQIRRLCFYRDKIMVKPDNKDYNSYLTRLDDIKIIGQVASIFKLLK